MVAYRARVTTAGETTYKVRFRLIDKNTGKRTINSSETYYSEAEAAELASLLDVMKPEEALALLDQRRKVVSAKSSEWVFAAWFEHWVANLLTGLEPNTAFGYRSMARNHLFPVMGDMPLDVIGKAHVAQVINNMERAGRARKTIKNVRDLLSSCLGEAVEERLIDANPCRRVRVPRGNDHERQAARFLTTEEYRALHAYMPDHYKPLTEFLFGSGCRWSEATALQVRDLDVENGLVRINKAWKRVPGEGFKIGPPKSDMSTRTIPLPKQVVDTLEPLTHRGGRELLFTAQRGGVVQRSNYYWRLWVPACKELGMDDPRPGLHDARRTHASWLISRGVSLEDIQERLGHESIQVTRRAYAHLMPDARTRAAQVADVIFEELEQLS